MTKRQRADFWKYERLEEQLAAHHIPDGGALAKLLDRLAPFRPIMLRAHVIRCSGCDVLMQVGDTVFVTRTLGNLSPILCYTCGIGWEIYKGRLDVHLAVNIPPIGGPAT